MHVFVEIALAGAILGGIRLMGAPETAAHGNRLAALSLLAAILLVLWRSAILTAPIILVSLASGILLGLLLAYWVNMRQMPQMVALLNGLGGAASMLTAFVVAASAAEASDWIRNVTAVLAVALGDTTLSGSVVAVAKLQGLISQRPIRLWGSRFIKPALLVLLFLLMFFGAWRTGPELAAWIPLVAVSALALGTFFALPVGGADMPIAISLLNSMSGIAASICGFVVDDALLVAAGAIVGAAGLILTRVMSGAMNRSLFQILTGVTVASGSVPAPGNYRADDSSPVGDSPCPVEQDKAPVFDPVDSLLEAKTVVIIPGYGMALGEAEAQVRDLYDMLERLGKDVQFAIHPVAGRMPGHMTVLLADVDIPYDKMVQLETINPEFAQTDIVLIVGACDVVNPGAITAEGTPIYGMPILRAHDAKRVIVCNADTKPGYSGVDNPLYSRDNVVLLLGNAASTLEGLFMELSSRVASRPTTVD